MSTTNQVLVMSHEALAPFAEEPTPAMDSYPCHRGICPKETCGRCSRAIAAYHAMEAIGNLLVSEGYKEATHVRT